ncbi:hypothetical protein D9M68_982890 [compost metagenome]
MRSYATEAKSTAEKLKELKAMRLAQAARAINHATLNGSIKVLVTAERAAVLGQPA